MTDVQFERGDEHMPTAKYDADLFFSNRLFWLLDILIFLTYYKWVTRSLISQDWEPHLSETARMETSSWITAMNAD